jgi:hypothetical protein
VIFAGSSRPRVFSTCGTCFSAQDAAASKRVPETLPPPSIAARLSEERCIINSHQKVRASPPLQKNKSAVISNILLRR